MFHSVAGALAATLSAAFLGAAAPASTVPAPSATALAVTVVTANGSGCPNATATARVLPDGSSFTIDFGGYFAWAGGDAPPTAFRRNCQFVIQVTRPEGLTYAVAGAEYSGFALLNEGVTGVQAARYYFQGQSATTVGSHQFTGPFADTWETEDAFAPDELVFAPCLYERNLNVNTEVRLTPQPATAELNAIVLDPSLTVHLEWQACA
jgi:hypothetical protein